MNEPVRSYAPGSPERAELQTRLASMAGERIHIPMVIGGERVETGTTFEAVMPHRREHVLADVEKGTAAEVERAIGAARAAHAEWSRTPWHERVAIFLRAAELISGPWRSTMNAATMLNQSKTAYQAEIDAACESIDFLRFNADYLVRIYEEQPVSSQGVWNRLEYRPLEGFVFAISPFNFTAIGANLTTSPALMGNTVVWKPASTQALSAWYTLRVLEEAGLPAGVINLVFGPGAEMGAAALSSPELAGVHFTGSTGVFQSIWRTIGNGIDRYRNYPRIVGETGGKDFILAHPSADPAAVSAAIVRGSFEYQGQKCSASSRLYIPSNLWGGGSRHARQRGRDDQGRRRQRLHELHGGRHRRVLLRDAARRDRRGAGGRGGDRRRRRHRRQRGLVRRADRDQDRRPRVPAPPRRALRPGRDGVRLRREQVGGHARPRRLDRRRTR